MDNTDLEIITKKANSSFQFGYIIQTIFAVAGLGGCLSIIGLIGLFIGEKEFFNPRMIITITVFLLIFITYIVRWIITTVNCRRHYSCCEKRPIKSTDDNQNIDYIRLEATEDDSAVESKSNH
jgi:hypothetical protein